MYIQKYHPVCFFFIKHQMRANTHASLRVSDSGKAIGSAWISNYSRGCLLCWALRTISCNSITEPSSSLGSSHHAMESWIQKYLDLGRWDVCHSVYYVTLLCSCPLYFNIPIFCLHKWHMDLISTGQFLLEGLMNHFQFLYCISGIFASDEFLIRVLIIG